ncbi:ShlB/FhaC/HecB family hemolysin secretion/activation protein [Crocosphaera sp.]|uniref:ShlB/FhaC/HecB family hemolysin secretion/activation protein n=1 Tax=Crocosphaera sp. TaxID=2729996 RepID=UPI0026113FBB|nr:ShlB/FhaC/HecB family hemolysin secretion/activation protein [Crocosphaera sp.]MDJ0581762.1 ShlB/FhaC/HecB family hemolysin secretion/activation protein [Crocosphaera sp.]
MLNWKTIVFYLCLGWVFLSFQRWSYPLDRSDISQDGDNGGSVNSIPSEIQQTYETCPLHPQNQIVYSTPFSLFSLQVKEKNINVRIRGNSAFTRQQILDIPTISELYKKYQGENLNLEKFNQIAIALADAITNHYLSEGYITSKAVFNPVNEITENTEVEIVIIEGNIAELKLIGRKKIHLDFICDRLLLAIGSPLNVTQLEKQLRLLLLNPLFENVDAKIQTSGQPGLSIIVANIKESDNWKFGLGIDNFSPPSIGSDRSGTFLKYNNLTGWGDNISLSYYRSTTNGGNTIDAIYQLPLNPQEGTLQIRVIPTWTRITQAPLDDFNIEGNKQIYEMSFRQPLWRDLFEEFSLSVGFLYQNQQTLINGEVAPVDNARNRSTIFQFGQDYLSRDQQGLWFLSSQFNWGVDLFDATISSDSTPDSRFFSWLFQGQRIQQLDENNLMVIRGELQLTPDSLLPDQWFIIGGAGSIRGYRQNVRFADNGFRLSVENRTTVMRNNFNQSTLEIAPFIDMGSVWFTDTNNTSTNKNFLMGTGLGLIWNDVATIEGLNLRLDYGIPLIPLPRLGNNLQERGLYFQINYSP